MAFDLRKLARWVINIAALVVAVTTLPEFGSLVPTAWLPEIASATAILNLILTWIRQVQTGEGLLHKPF